MSIVGSNALAGASGQSTGGSGGSGYQITKSVRLNSADLANFTRTTTSASNRKTWTYSLWAKLQPATIGGYNLLWSATPSGSSGDQDALYIDSSTDQMIFMMNITDPGGSNFTVFQTQRKFRDPSAWYHIVLRYDATASSNYAKLWINGVEETAFTTDNRNSSTLSNHNAAWNSVGAHRIGVAHSNNDRFNGYLAEIHFVDGTALAASDFGEFDSNNLWRPKQYSGTHGPTPVNYYDNSQTDLPDGNVYLSTQPVENIFDGNDTTYARINRGTNGQSVATFKWEPTGGYAGVTKLRIKYNYSQQYRINGGSWANVNNNGGYQEIYNGSAFTLNTLEIRRSDASGSDYGIFVHAIEINDSLVTNISNNGFYLNFSDNTSAVTIAEDSSGNNNDWTANNITTTAADNNWADYVYAGGSTYSSTETGTNYFTGAGSSENLFDGNLNSQVGGTNASNSWVYFRPATAITGVTSLRLYGAYNSTTKINGTNYSESPSWSSTAAWVTVPSPPSSITEIALQGSGGAAARVSAIEVNGVVLVDPIAAKDLDSMIDTPTNYTAASGNNGGNYCVLNPLDKRDSPTYSEGNLQVTGNGAAHCVGRSTFGVSSGKWYWEATINSSINSTYYPSPGICSMDTSVPNQLGDGTSGHAYMANGQKYTSGSLSSYGASFTQDDIIGFALDLDAGTLVAYKNGTSQGTMATGLTGSWSPSWNQYNSTSLVYNFGQRPFQYPPGGTGGPSSDYKSLCTTNLPDPTISDPSTAMDVALWTGNGSSAQTISTPNLSPDMVWVKERSSTSSHAIIDSVRGATNAAKVIYPDRTDAEVTANSTQSITSLNSNGFTIGSSDNSVNQSSQTYVGWAWEGGSLATGTYSSYDQSQHWSANTSGALFGGVVGNLFDTATSTGIYPGTSGAAGTFDVTLTFSPGIACTSLRVYTKDKQSYATGSVSANGGTHQSVPGNDSWTTLTAPSTLNSLVLRRVATSASNNAFRFTAIEVTGRF